MTMEKIIPPRECVVRVIVIDGSRLACIYDGVLIGAIYVDGVVMLLLWYCGGVG